MALYWWAEREYRHTFYRLDAQGIEIRRGVYWRVVINVPRSRVQHTDVSQGPVERRYGLGTLVIYTAGTDHAKVDLAGSSTAWPCAFAASSCHPGTPMPSEQRLHPATLLFDIAKHARAFAIPAVLVLFGASQSSGGPGGMFGRMPGGWEVWLLVLLVPAWRPACCAT